MHGALAPSPALSQSALLLATPATSGDMQYSPRSTSLPSSSLPTSGFQGKIDRDLDSSPFTTPMASYPPTPNMLRLPCSAAQGGFPEFQPQSSPQEAYSASSASEDHTMPTDLGPLDQLQRALISSHWATLVWIPFRGQDCPSLQVLALECSQSVVLFRVFSTPLPWSVAEEPSSSSDHRRR